MANGQAAFDTAEFLASGGSGRALRRYAKQQVIFSQGEPADAVFYIRAGRVGVIAVSANGRESVSVVVLGPDEFFGEGALGEQTERTATATAVTECDVTRIEKAALIGVFTAEPDFATMFLEHVLAGTARLEQHLAVLQFSDTTSH